MTVFGFNNIRRRYQYATADNYDSVVLFYTSPIGVEDPRKIEVFAEYVDVGRSEDVSGGLVITRILIERESDDHHLLRNFYAAAGREEYLFLEYFSRA